MTDKSKKKVSKLAVVSLIFIVLGFSATPLCYLFRISQLSVLFAVGLRYIAWRLFHVGLGPFAFALILWFIAMFFALLALVLKRFKSEKQKSGVLPYACLIISLLSIIAFAIPYPNYDDAYVVDKEKTFDGKSSELENTAIVPTLDTLMPEGKNVIWCSSFQLAWNELKDDVIKEPILLDENQEMADLLNQAAQSKQDISESDYYARAGFVHQDIIQTIQTEMAQQFPEEPVPSFDDIPIETAIISYSFIKANARFTIPFFENEEQFFFTDSGGNKTAIASFGLRDEDTSRYEKLRQQVQVLFAKRNSDFQLTECAIDLCKESSPNQVIIAMVDPKETLSQTLSYIDEQCQKASSGGYGFEFKPNEFHLNDVLLVPNLFWKITHSYENLKGNTLQNTGFEEMPISEAMQVIQFRLDRSGAALKSRASVLAACGSTHYIFDRPFLIYMKKRGAEHPFFVMWVDNAELLEKF